MNWDAVGAIGEIAGALAVVITIVYLARQVRDNSRQVKLNTSQAYAGLVQDAYDAVYTNDSTIHAWLTGTDSPETLGQQEMKLYLHLMDRQMNNVVPLLNHYEESAISSDEFEHYRSFFIALISSEGGQHWQQQRSAQFLSVIQRMQAA